MATKNHNIRFNPSKEDEFAGMYLMQQQAFVSASMQSGITPVMPQMNQQMQESKHSSSGYGAWRRM